MRVFVVDDEALARARMRRLLAAYGDIDIAGEADDGARALALIAQARPDVVLLDVEMPGDDGMTVADAIRRLEPPPAVIFVTAYENYAVEAFGVRALDYLVKPVRAARLEEALQRVRVLRPDTGRQALSARVGECVQRIPLDAIRMLEATDKYTQIHHLQGTSLADDSLVALEQEFPHRFVRIHRATLVSRAHMIELFRDDHGHERVRLADCAQAPKVSRRNLAKVRQWIRR